MRIVKNRVHGECVSHLLTFNYVGERSWGFSFDCDAAGKVDLAKLNPSARSNYEDCLKGESTRLVGVEYYRNPDVSSHDEYKAIFCTGHWQTFKVQPGEVIELRNWYSEPAIGLCNRCSGEVVLHGFTNTCECGADYNMSGQELAPRSQWGEETGESLSDILSVDSDNQHDFYD